MTPSTLTVSVVVPTHRRPDLLQGALESLAAQTLAVETFEVLVVDNAVQEETRHLVDQAKERLPCLRYVAEPRVGLSHARNRGWKEARGGYVAYTDDDCLLPEHWLTVAKEIIDRDRPAVFGGPYRPFYLEAPPRWFKDRYGSGGYQGDSPHQATEDLRGGNIFIRRDLLIRLGGFDPQLGMAGAKLAYGEETDFQRRLREGWPDERLLYDPRLCVRHAVRPEKTRLRWVSRAAFGKGRTYVRMTEPAGNENPRWRHLCRILGSLLRMTGALAVAAVHRDRQRYPYLANYFYECTRHHIRSIGCHWERFSRARSAKAGAA